MTLARAHGRMLATTWPPPSPLPPPVSLQRDMPCCSAEATPLLQRFLIWPDAVAAGAALLATTLVHDAYPLLQTPTCPLLLRRSPGGPAWSRC